MFCKSILVLSLLAITHALPHSKLSTRQSEITGSNGDTLINIQTFNETLGSDPIPVYYDAGLGVANGNRPFNVSGVTYDGVASALQNSCSLQMNACADAANAGTIAAVVSDCTDQQADCQDVADTISSNAEFTAQKKRGVTSEIGDGIGSSSEALLSPETPLRLKVKAVRRTIQGFFVDA